MHELRSPIFNQYFDWFSPTILFHIICSHGKIIGLSGWYKKIFSSILTLILLAFSTLIFRKISTASLWDHDNFPFIFYRVLLTNFLFVFGSQLLIHSWVYNENIILKFVKKYLVISHAMMAYVRYYVGMPQLQRDLIRDCEADKIDLVIGCDVNAHHTVWGSTDCCVTGKDLLEFLGTINLDILNIGCKPNFKNAVREEVIDITLP